jgi:hypothetical protein
MGCADIQTYNMVRNFLYLVIALFLITSCSRSRLTDSELEKAKKEVILTHDASSYLDLTCHYSDSLEYMEQLPYDLIMCNANNCAACYNFYVNYIKACNSGKFEKASICKLDKPEQDFLLYILNKGALKGDEYCRSYLYYYYKNGIVVKKDLLKADSLSKFFPEGYFDNVDL